MLVNLGVDEFSEILKHIDINELGGLVVSNSRMSDVLSNQYVLDSIAGYHGLPTVKSLNGLIALSKGEKEKWLLIAASIGDERAVKWILSRRPEYINPYTKPIVSFALKQAAIGGFSEVIDVFLSSELDEYTLETAMQAALVEGKYNIVRKFLEFGLDDYDYYFIVAAGHGQIVNLDILLEYRNIGDDVYGEAIVHAAEFGHVDTIMWLFDILGSSKIKLEYLDRALDIASKEGYDMTVAVLRDFICKTSD